MKKEGLIILLLFFCFSVFGQKNRYRFAETYFGLEAEYSHENNSFLYEQNGSISNQALPSQITPRLLIGGTHFWRRADFYISLPLGSFNLSGSKNIDLSNNVLTGFRYLPFSLKRQTVRPFIGIGMNAKELKLNNGPKYTNWQWYYEGGLNYFYKNRIIGLEVRYFPKSEFYNAYTRTDFQNTALSPLSFSVSYKFVFDATAGYSTEGSKQYMKKIYEKADQSNAYDAFSFGVGLSALIPLGKTDLASNQAFFNDEIEGNISVDIGAGYYFSKIDAALRASFRPLKQEESAFDYTYRLRRNSLALEAFKFIGDYHGFAPFIGPYVSADLYKLKEIDFGQTVNELEATKLGYGIVFGWDIRQTPMDYLILRTNLRYTPQFDYRSSGLKFTSKQIEFNFIQIVFYPERYKIWKNT